MATNNNTQKFVKIDAHMTYIVTPDLSFYNQTDYSNITNPNRLKIRANWNRKEVKLQIGSHWYPAEIAEWNTVKSLAKDAKITIGETRTNIDNEKGAAEAKTAATKLHSAEADIARQTQNFNKSKEAANQRTLSEIANHK